MFVTTLLILNTSLQDAVRLQPQLIISGTYATNLLSNTLVVGLLLGMLGIIQTAVVRWTVGLNLVGVNRLTYSVNIDVKTLESVFDKSFTHTWMFKLKEKSAELRVFRLHRNTGESVVVAFGSDPRNKEQSILATVASDYAFYEVTVSKEANDIRDSIIRDLKGKLEGKKPNIILTDVGVDDLVSLIAYAHARRPTMSKMSIGREILTGIPRYFLGAIVFTAIALLVTTIAFIMGVEHFDFGSYVGVVSFIAVALVVEIGIALRDELSHRKE